MSLRLRAALVALTLVLFAVVVSGQNPVSVFQWGSTAVVTGSGTATGALRVELASNGTGLLTAAQATAANLNATVVGTGTFAVQAAESGTWTVQPGNTANTTAWKITNADSGGTSMTDTTAHALKIFPVDPATGSALTVPSSGNGTSDSGTLRVAVASNNTAVSGMGVGVVGSAVPVNAVYPGGTASGLTGGALGAVTACDTQAFLNMTSATTTEIVALTSGRKVHVCYWLLQAGGTTTATFQRGTGSNCGTGTTAVSPGWELTAQSGFSGGSGFGEIFDNQTAANALCVTNSGSVNLHVFIRYAVF